jgi:hypothetical protein
MGTLNTRTSETRSEETAARSGDGHMVAMD